MEGSGGTGGGSSGDGKRVQNVVVMRHGDRVDHFEPLWVAHAPRPWDPPLTNAGRIRAWTVGKRLRGVGFPFHRVLVSPFLRCLQTASEVVRALCAVVEDDNPLLLMENSGEAVLNPSRIKHHESFLFFLSTPMLKHPRIPPLLHASFGQANSTNYLLWKI